MKLNQSELRLSPKLNLVNWENYDLEETKAN